MASFNIGPKDLKENLTLVVDMSYVERQVFGVFHWRMRLALALIRLAARVLRVGIRVEGE